MCHIGSCNSGYPKRPPWNSFHKISFPKHVFKTLFIIREGSWKFNLWSRLNNFLPVHPELSFPLNALKEAEHLRSKNLFSENAMVLPVSYRQAGTSLYQAALKNNICIISSLKRDNFNDVFVSDGGGHSPTPLCHSVWEPLPIAISRQRWFQTSV